jgi:predicted KAP-like P-loop ATPase
MWNDNETNQDFLGFDTLIEPAFNLLEKPALFPVTIGIFGDWGSGKSSLMNMLYGKLEKEDSYLCLKFNGWLFEGYEDAKAALLVSILLGLKQKQSKFDKSKEYIQKLAKKVDWMRLMGFFSKQAIAYGLYSQGVPTTSLPTYETLESVFKDGSEKEDLEQSIEDFRRVFSQMLDKSDLKALVIFIDDLDRCLPERIIETLEAIKLFLSVPKTAFVIGADERIIKHAVSSRYAGFHTLQNQASLDIGRDYLEKIIQFPLYIPKLNSIDTETFITLLFSQVYLNDKDWENVILRTHENRVNSVLDAPINVGILKEVVEKLPDEFDSALSLIGAIAPVLSAGLKGNPRLIKRFLNTLVLRQKIAKSRNVDLKLRILAKLMLLEYFRQERFEDLFRWQNENSNEILHLKALEHLNDEEKQVKDEIENKEELKIWVQDPWILNWLRIEPKLSKEKLGSYFYFSREKIPSATLGVRVLSQKLQELINHLISDTKVLRDSGLSKIGSLDLSELEEIFEILTQRYLSEESNVKKWIKAALIEILAQRYEFKTKYIAFMRNLSLTEIEPSLPMKLMRLTTTSDKYKELKDLVEIWSKDQSKIGNAARTALERTKYHRK